MNRDATYARNTGKWSETRSFTLPAGNEPQTHSTGPALFSPADGALDINPAPDFNWAPLPDAERYEISIFNDMALHQAVDSATVTGTTYTYEGSLTPGKTYYWQVKAIEPYESQPGPAFSFTVRSQTKAGPPDNLLSDLLWLWIIIAVIVAAGITSIVFITLRKKAH